MGSTTIGAALQLNALRASITHVGAIDSSTEVSSARAAYTFPATANNSLVATDDVSLPIPSGDGVTDIGFYTALTGGDLLRTATVGVRKTNPTPGYPWTLVVDSSTLTLGA